MQPIHDSRAFYDSVPIFNRFADVSDPLRYVAVPDDWDVVITDIKGSTKAIEQNRYKEVNLLGASSIVAVLNALGGKKIPFVFGGDGATILIHVSDREKVLPALRATQRFAQGEYGMELRVGVVPVRDLSKRGAHVNVARFRLSDRTTLAMINGGGLQVAEALVKDSGDYAVAAMPEEMDGGDFSGLSCRWQPIPAKHGEMVSLLVLALRDPQRVYRETLERIEQILESGANLDPTPGAQSSESHATTSTNDTRPLTLQKIDAMKRRLDFRALAREYRMRTVGKSFREKIDAALRIVVGAVVVFAGYRFGIKFSFFDTDAYVRDLVVHTDFRKFDDMLRMIRDCNPSQRAQIVSLLEEKRAAGELVFGVHVSESALMTCLMFSMDDHVHFIDGGGGGYAMAARQLKTQLRALPSV